MAERAESLGSRGLHLFALCGFAIAQPLLDLISRHAPFLVAHDLGAGEIATLAAVLLVAPALVLWSIEALLGVVSAGLSRTFHHLLVTILVAATLLPVVHRMEGVTGDVAVALSVGAGAFATVAYTGMPALRRLVSFLAPAPLLFAAVFVLDDSISKLLFEPRGSDALDVEVGSPSPVVFVVFDELPLTSLLEAPGKIDRIRYPAFRRLARQSTWYSNASTVHSHTVSAIPALLTGRYPEADRLPNASDHPHNLFTLLAGHYEMEVQESFTRLWQPRDPREPGDTLLRWRTLGADMGVLYLHILLPADLAEALPSLTHGWRDFRGDTPGRDGGRDDFSYGKTPVQTFRRAIASIEKGERPGFWYVHVNLPHRPWQFMPNGRAYLPTRDYGLRENQWRGSAWWVTHAYQRHLLQLELADRLLGELLDHLRSEDLLDEVLLVVVSDHGASFWPGEARRDPARMSHPEDVLSVPLFIKVPGQRHGSVDARNVETIDVLPTVAAALEVEVPWSFDGCSLQEASCPERADKVIFNKEHQRLEIPFDVMHRTDSLQRKLEWFGSGGRRQGLFRLSRFAALVGRRLADLSVEVDEDATVLLDREPFAYAAARPDEMSVARVVGALEGYTRRKNKAFVAVAANGVVGAVVPAIAQSGGRFFFSAMLPENAQPAVSDDLQLFVVDGLPDAPRIAQVRFSLGSVRDDLAPAASMGTKSGVSGTTDN